MWAKLSVNECRGQEALLDSSQEDVPIHSPPPRTWRPLAEPIRYDLLDFKMSSYFFFTTTHYIYNGSGYISDDVVIYVQGFHSVSRKHAFLVMWCKQSALQYAIKWINDYMITLGPSLWSGVVPAAVTLHWLSLRLGSAQYHHTPIIPSSSGCDSSVLTRGRRRQGEIWLWAAAEL